MKKRLLISACVFLALQILLFAQNTPIPSVDLYTLDGEKVNSTDIFDDSRPTILVFWKTFEKECCNQISSMIEARQEVIGKDNVRIVCVCIDCTGKTTHVKPIIYGKDWDIEAYVDKNGDFKRAMNVTSTPLTILYDAEQSIICRYAGYCPGAEEMVCEKLSSTIVMK